jgi:hypothetical protein
MRRLPHGSTTRPPLERPGNGFGRTPKVGPPPTWRDPETVMRARQRDLLELLLSDDVLVDLNAVTL